MAEFILPCIGDIVDERYKIVKRLGEGGMGIVFKAEQLDLLRTVSMKFLRPDVHPDEDSYKRFEREAKSISLLQHQNICQFFTWGIWQGRPYFVMEFVEGQDLQHLIATSGAIQGRAFRKISLQLCAALAHAHTVGIVHRDLKPSNVMIDESGCLKIIDFGLAKLIHGAEGFSEKLTQTGLLVGTASYASPEQCLGQPADERSDIYSVGCILYHMLTASQPFEAGNNMAVMFKQLHDMPRSLSSVRGCEDLPVELEEVVDKALNKDPERRYQNADELAEALNAIDWNKKQFGRRTKIPAARQLLIAGASCLLFLCGALMVHSNLSGANSPVNKYVSLYELDRRYLESMRSGDLNQALAILRERERLFPFPRGSDRDLELRLWRGHTLQQMGKHEQALRMFHECVPLSRDNPGRLAVCYGHISDILADFARWEEAFSFSDLSIKTSRSAPNRDSRSYVFYRYASWLIGQNRDAEAQKALEKAKGVYIKEDQGYRSGNTASVIDVTQAVIWMRAGKFLEAEQLLRSALALCREEVSRADIETHILTCLVKQKRFQEARVYAEELLERYRAPKFDRVRKEVKSSLSEARSDQ